MPPRRRRIRKSVPAEEVRTIMAAHSAVHNEHSHLITKLFIELGTYEGIVESLPRSPGEKHEPHEFNVFLSEASLAKFSSAEGEILGSIGLHLVLKE